MPREPVLEAISAQPGEVLADIGAGLGWLSLPLAAAVGGNGQVWAIEPSEGGVEALTQIALEQELSQLYARAAYAESLPISDSSVDKVVWHTVALHMGDRRQAMTETFRILRSGGRWVVVDWKLVSTPTGPALEHRVSAETVETEALTCGFRLTRKFEPGPVTWGLVFAKP